MNEWDANDSDGWTIDDSTMGPLDKIEVWARQAGYQVWLEMNAGAERKLVRRLFHGFMWDSVFEAIEDGEFLQITVKLPVVLWVHSIPAVKSYLIRLPQALKGAVFCPDATGSSIVLYSTLDIAYVPLTQARFCAFFDRALAACAIFLEDFAVLTSSAPAAQSNGRCFTRTPRRRHQSRGRQSRGRRGQQPGAGGNSEGTPEGTPEGNPPDCDRGDWSA